MKFSKRKRGDIVSLLKNIVDLHSHFYILSTRREYLSSRERMVGKKKSVRAEGPDLEHPLRQIKKLRLETEKWIMSRWAECPLEPRLLSQVAMVGCMDAMSQVSTVCTMAKARRTEATA